MRKFRAVLPLLLASTPVFAQTTYAPGADHSLVVKEAADVVGEFPMPCAIDQVFEHPTQRLVTTCKDKPGLLIVDVLDPKAPRAVEIVTYQGRLKNIYWVGKDLWVDVDQQGSWPLKFEDRVAKVEQPAAPQAVEATEEIPEPASTEDTVADVRGALLDVVGTVLKFDGRDVVVDLGKDDGFRKGDSLEFYVLKEIELSNEVVTKEETLTLGRIRNVSPQRSVVEVSLNEDIPEGALVRLSRKEYNPNIFAPPRNPSQTEVTFTVRPYLALGTLGGGAMMDASVMRRFDAPLAVDFRLSPMGFAITNDGNAGVFAAHGFVTYDTRLFQLGLGAGAARFESDEAPYMLTPGQEEPELTKIAFSAGQYIRLGARDGLMLTVTTNFVAHNDKFDFGGMSAEFQTPISAWLPDTWLIFRGGGGLPGHGFGEVGLRTLLAGNGNSGTVFLTPTLGGAVITTERYAEDEYYNDGNRYLQTEDYGGPMVGITVEWRP